MNVFDVLILGAELSLALAGFAGIIATFQFRDKEKVRRSDAMGLSMIVNYSLTGAFYCGAILILNVAGFSGTLLWSIASILVAFVGAYLLISSYRIMKGAIRNGVFRKVMWMLQGITATIVIANLLNAADIIFHRTPTPSLVSTAWALIIAGWMFSRLLLIPIWRALKLREGNEATV